MWYTVPTFHNTVSVVGKESFKSTRLGFEDRKRIPRRMCIENVHTFIIDRDIWEKVQMIRENRHRPTKSGKPIRTIFS